jgi:hypothetical protein
MPRGSGCLLGLLSIYEGAVVAVAGTDLIFGGISTNAQNDYMMFATAPLGIVAGLGTAYAIYRSGRAAAHPVETSRTIYRSGIAARNKLLRRG